MPWPLPRYREMLFIKYRQPIEAGGYRHEPLPCPAGAARREMRAAGGAAYRPRLISCAAYPVSRMSARELDRDSNVSSTPLHRAADFL